MPTTGMPISVFSLLFVMVVLQRRVKNFKDGITLPKNSQPPP